MRKIVSSRIGLPLPGDECEGARNLLLVDVALEQMAVDPGEPLTRETDVFGADGHEDLLALTPSFYPIGSPGGEGVRSKVLFGVR
jgi:hypothetical protein